MASKRNAPAGQPGATEWADGCLGYACNLVRPSVAGHRAALLYPLMSMLVFETLQHATKYREYCTQVHLILAGWLDGQQVASMLLPGWVFLPPLCEWHATQAWWGISSTFPQAKKYTSLWGDP